MDVPIVFTPEREDVEKSEQCVGRMWEETAEKTGLGEALGLGKLNSSVKRIGVRTREMVPGGMRKLFRGARVV